MLHPSLHSFLRDFTVGLDGIFGAGFEGLYLHGSIALDAFDPASSDVDFVVVLRSPPRKNEMIAVRKLHRTLCRGSEWGKRLDGYYLFRHEGIPHPFPGKYPYLLRGRMRKNSPLPAAARYLLHRNGVGLAGRNPREIFTEVLPEELRAEMVYNLEIYWRGRLNRPWRFLFEEMVDFAVATLPRILFTLETGVIIPKMQGLRFLEERFPEWRPLVDDLRSRQAARQPLLHRLQRSRMALRFVRWMIEEGRKHEKAEACGPAQGVESGGM